MQGGKFGHGFVSAGVTEALAPTIADIDSKYLAVAVSAMVGGTVSELSSGKFGNGAITGAFQMAFNQLAHDDGEPTDEMNREFRDDGYVALSG